MTESERGETLLPRLFDMSIPGITYLSTEVEVVAIEPTEAALDAFGYGYGAGYALLTEEHIALLRLGKVLAFGINAGEYRHFIALRAGEGNHD